MTISSSESFAREIQRHVVVLANEIGERHVAKPEALATARDYIESQLKEVGLTPVRQSYQVENKTVSNIVAEVGLDAGGAETLIIGAHYDTVPGTPGANDNGTGVAGLLALAGRFAKTLPDRPVRLVAFVNEEPPFFHGPLMGSLVYATACRERQERLLGAIVLETIGCYLDEPGTQRVPDPLRDVYPTTGNFIAFVGDGPSADLVERCAAIFAQHSRVPVQTAATSVPLPGVDWSDHWSFWQHDYRAFMVTDTAPFRYVHYHEPSDTPDRLDFDRTAEAVAGLEAVARKLEPSSLSSER